ncbi:MAG: sulfite exporter TauE/SafE family protein [Sandaracinaceae bacterium]|nr:sulfite exporter TauE/SafE family protein [Sandaracinaceae bacterium]MBK7776658.1 sulfite exporter TauE/SafE family protein [Sandaracinaceae bacterium]MBK8407479.1 sulfite exporter TauE/SafE family protein [Sandaracinaceae bacterium]
MSAAHLLGVVAAGAVAGLASVPHCMGMCGPLVAGVCAGPREGLRYQAGRTLSYGLLGGLAGGLVALTVRPLPVEFASQVLGVTMALGLLWVAFRLASSAPRAMAAPGGEASDVELSGVLVPLRTKPKSAPTPSRWVRLVRPFLASPLLVGALSALLPCAALLNMGVLAGASGSATAGALIGVAFATTTGAGLATSVWASTLLRQSRAGSLLVAGVLVLGAGIVTVRAMPGLLGQAPMTEGGAACHADPIATGREAPR